MIQLDHAAAHVFRHNEHPARVIHRHAPRAVGGAVCQQGRLRSAYHPYETQLLVKFDQTCVFGIRHVQPVARRDEHAGGLFKRIGFPLVLKALEDFRFLKCQIRDEDPIVSGIGYIQAVAFYKQILRLIQRGPQLLWADGPDGNIRLRLDAGFLVIVVCIILIRRIGHRRRCEQQQEHRKPCRPSKVFQIVTPSRLVLLTERPTDNRRALCLYWMPIGCYRFL